jgi:hypothetical protein
VLAVDEVPVFENLEFSMVIVPVELSEKYAIPVVPVSQRQ